MPKNQAAPITQDAAIQEMNRLLFEAPIAELAESQGISIDEAVKLRVEKSIEAAPAAYRGNGTAHRAYGLPAGLCQCQYRRHRGGRF